MKSKFFSLFVLFMLIGAYSFAQMATDGSNTQKDAPKKEVTIDNSKGSVSASGNAAVKADCKWVDSNNDGLCDVCGEKDCGKKEAKAATHVDNPSGCPVKSSCKPSGCCPSKDGKKNE
jgi:hypothetical protein